MGSGGTAENMILATGFNPWNADNKHKNESPQGTATKNDKTAKAKSEVLYQ